MKEAIKPVYEKAMNSHTRMVIKRAIRMDTDGDGKTVI